MNFIKSYECAELIATVPLALLPLVLGGPVWLVLLAMGLQFSGVARGLHLLFKL